MFLPVLSFGLGAFLPYGGYGTMRGYSGWGMPRMYGSYGMFFPGMLFMWLIPVGVLILIGLAIAWFVRSLNAPKG